MAQDLVDEPDRTRPQRDQAAHQRRRAFPNDTALLRLVTAVIAETHDEWQVCDRRYLSEGSMNKLYENRDETPAGVLTTAIAS